MHFTSFFSLSCFFFHLYSCRPTAAATLAVSPVKRMSMPIDCQGPPPDYTPPDFTPRFADLNELCAMVVRYPRNLECICIGTTLICGASPRRDVQRLIEHCFNNCWCGDGTVIDRNEATMQLNYQPLKTSAGNPIKPGKGSGRNLAGSNPTGNNPTTRTHACSKTCTAVNHDCDRFFTGDCKCYAPPATSLFWHSGGCGLVSHLPKRDLAQHRCSYYLNATAQFASSNGDTAPPGPPHDLAAQLASGLLPSPCNASYVSFSCADSTDGIVHEPPQNWLGALLPGGANSKTHPPVPERWLRIHGEEGNSQERLAKVTVD